jgi:3-oxoacyl-[acyl-carrier protein] reductase
LHSARPNHERANSPQLPEDFRKHFAEEEIPVGYWGEPEDLAALAVFLASPVARYITGTVIPVDGGLRRYQF